MLNIYNSKSNQKTLIFSHITQSFILISFASLSCLMSLNVSSRSNLSNPSYNPNLIKYDKNLLKSNDLRLLPTKEYLKTYSYKSDETEEFINNVLSDNWIDSVKQYNLESLGGFSNKLISINFEDFKFQNLKERIKIIEIRNRKNSTQSSKVNYLFFRYYVY